MIAGILEMPAAHRGRVYPLYGAAAMTFPEIAAEMSNVLGREIRYQALPGDLIAKIAATVGFPEFAIQHVSEAGAPDFRNGLFAGMNDIVERIGGRRPIMTRRAALFAPEPGDDEGARL